MSVVGLVSTVVSLLLGLVVWVWMYLACTRTASARDTNANEHGNW